MILNHVRRISVLCFLVLLFSCASTPKQEEKVEDPELSQQSSEDFIAEQGTAIAVTQPVVKSFFYGVDESVMDLIENGSPLSLKSALTILRRTNDSSYAEKNNILANIASSILQLCWKINSTELFFPEVNVANPYQGAIESSKMGVYDYSTGKSDFLTLVLPSIVLVVSDSRYDYYQSSRDDLLSASYLHENSYILNYLSGVLEKKSGNYKSAINYFLRILSVEEPCEELLYNLADSYYKNGDYKQAYETARRIYDNNNLNSKALKLCAKTSFANKDYDNAELFVAKILQQESENYEYILFRARILLVKNDYIRAASLLDMYARNDTKSKDYLLLRSKVQKDWNRNITAAVSTIETALKLYPDDGEIILAAAQLSSDTGLKIGGYDASALAARILKNDSTNTQALEIQVNDFMNRKEWDEAYKASLSLLDNNGDWLANLIVHLDICIALKKNTEAWTIASKIYSEQSDNDDCKQAYLKTLVALGRNQDAKKFIDQNISTANAKFRSFLYYEKSFLSSGEEEILKDLRASLTANPRNKDSLFRLYTIYFEKKEYKKAQYYLKQVVAISPADESLLSLNRKLEELIKK